jgi:hypothetical protein
LLFLFSYNPRLKIEALFIMNRIQRFTLIFSAVLILFFSDSAYGDSSYLKLFIVTVLLLFGLSPQRWFHKKQANPTATLALTPESEQDENQDSSSLPHFGFSSPEQSLIIKALIKLRSAEIGNVYLALRQHQKEAKDGNWVLLFMKQMSTLELHGPYTHVEKEEEEKAEREAMVIFEERYKFCSIAPTELYEDQIADLHVALLYWRYSPQTIINRLEEFRSFGFLTDRLDALIKAYQEVDKCGGSFKSIFKSKKTGSFRPSLKRISFLWSEIIRILKMSMFLQQIKSGTPNEQHADENIDLQELEALIELERYLDCAITQENLDPKSFISLPNKEKEKFFLSRLTFNPLWYHYS